MRMAQFGKDVDNFSASRAIRIIKSEILETYTVYVIQVTVGPYSWTVKHRYSDFYELHEKLVSTCKLDKNLLPPKKLFGNQSETFVKKRQTDLEVYLQTVLYYVVHKLPSALASFLDFDRYEIHGITQCMAEELYNKGDLLLQTREVYQTSPLQLYALTERLKLPEPTCESGDVKRDIGHILDFITRLKVLRIQGGDPVGTSTIDMNQLKFDLTLFKSLQSLQLEKCNASMITGLETVKQTLQKVIVHETVDAIKDVLLQEFPHWKTEDGAVVVSHLSHVTHVDFSHNNITTIDDSVQLMPRVERLHLRHNKITSIQHLQWLSHMTYLDLSHNAIQHLEALHTKLGNLKTLKLAGNKLQSLQGFSKLFSLETLDVSDNKISEVQGVQPISGLPCLENLLLLGNPVYIVLDYRTTILAMFGDRVNEVCLDGFKPSQKELDTVAVLQAIQKSKEKAKEGIMVKRNSSRVSMSSDLAQQGSYTADQSPRGTPASPPIVKTSDLSPKGASSTAQPVFPSQTSALAFSIGSNAHAHSAASHSQYEGESQSVIREQSHRSHSQRSNSSQQPNMMNNSQLERPRSQESDEYFDALDQDLNGAGFIRYPVPPISPSRTNTKLLSLSVLPSMKNEEFRSWLHMRLFGEDSASAHEKIVHILWCSTVQYSQGNRLLPSCAVLTERRIFILQLKSSDSNFEGVPEMETFYILPLCNIQQVVVGLCYSYVRLEESFVGAPGTFALLSPSADSGKSFFDSLIRVCRDHKDNGEPDTVNLSQTSDLAKQIFDLEDELGFCTGRIAYATHVKMVETGSLMYLLLSENQAYIVDTSCLFWPKPTFDTGEEGSGHKYDIKEQFGVEAKLSDIRKYAPENGGKVESPSASDNQADVQFENFRMSMMFHEMLGTHKFEFLFISAWARDAFMDRLTNLRAEHAHRMSPSMREEPEGGNESSDSMDASGGCSKVKEDTQECHGSGDKSGDCGDMNNEGDDKFDSDQPDGGTRSVVGTGFQRKIRSKTEMGLPTPSLHVEPPREVPSYTWSYMSPELNEHLTVCIQKYPLMQYPSQKLFQLTQMTGQELVQNFHKTIVPVGIEGEELHHVMWTNVIPYRNPNEEIITCVMLSNRAVYFVSDRIVQSPRSPSRPAWMTHTRHVSDTVINWPSRLTDKHHSSGIIHSGEHDGVIVKPYHILEFKDIHQINVGLFDQCVRLTGSNRDSVFTLATRDSEASSMFMKNLSTMLSLFISSPMLDKSTDSMEQDFYRAFDKRTKTTVEGMEYVHPSKVKFCYPGDESIADLLFIINEQLELKSLKVGREQILTYILGFCAVDSGHSNSMLLPEARSLILTNDCLCVISEDLVSYPLPDFVRGLPGRPRQKVTDVKKIEYLKYVKQSSENPTEVTLVFSDEKEDIVLVFDHYSMKNNQQGRESPPEIPVKLFIQSERERKKFLQLLSAQWEQKHNGANLKMMVV